MNTAIFRVGKKGRIDFKLPPLKIIEREARADEMIPLADDSRRPVSFPVATTAIIGINFAASVVELIGGDQLVTR